jgi:hypothetical protein
MAAHQSEVFDAAIFADDGEEPNRPLSAVPLRE